MRAPTSEIDFELDDKDIPEAFICPITNEMMQDPVMLVSGHSYERFAITNWLESHNTCPYSGQVLSSLHVFPNWSLKSAIDTFLAKKPYLQIKRLEAELQETQKKAASNIELEKSLRQTCNTLNEQALRYAQSMQQMQATIDQLSAEISRLKESSHNQKPRVSSVQSASESGLFSPRALGFNSNRKIIPHGLQCIVLTVGTPAGHANEGLSFGGVTLVFENAWCGENFKRELLKSSDDTNYPITMDYSQWPKLGDFLNNSGFFYLTLRDSEAHFMCFKKPELRGLLTLDIFEKYVDVTNVRKRVYYLTEDKFLDIKTLPNFSKIKPEGLDSIVLEVDEFFNTKRGPSFSGMKLIFKTAADTLEFREQINGICQKLQNDASWQVRYSHAGRINSNRDRDTILELFPISNSYFDSFLRKNMHLTGIMLLQALEEFFDISGIKKAIYSARDGWINQEPARHLSAALQPY